VRMAQAAGGARLAREAVAQFLGVERALEDLDGDVASDARIPRPEQRAHAALADQIKDFVAPEVFWNLHNLPAAPPREASLYRIGRSRRLPPAAVVTRGKWRRAAGPSPESGQTAANRQRRRREPRDVPRQPCPYSS